jgi:peptidoglycan-N-acetylglucosamine deacetylase
MLERVAAKTGFLMYPDTVWKIKTKEKKIFLTFDDGPCPETTPWILDTLKKAGAKATFFLIGRNADKYADLADKIQDHGHALGNHTYSHLNGWKTNKEEYINDVLFAETVINSGLFRPPYGKFSPAQYRLLKDKFKIIMWDVLSRDYSYRLSRNRCLQIVLGQTKKGSIVVFHDSLKARKNLEYALPRFLEHFAAKGYQFVTFSEI